MLQKYGPVLLGASECPSLTMILAVGSQNKTPKLNSVNVNNKAVYDLQSEKSGGKGALGLFNPVVQ